MQLIRLILVGLIALVAVLPVAAEDAKPDPREQLETAIPEGIRLLEAKEYKAFVKTYSLPADLKRITESYSIDEVVRNFSEQNAPRLLEILNEIKNAKPSLDDAGTTATYALKEEVGAKKSITFVKVKKYWYIKN